MGEDEIDKACEVMHNAYELAAYEAGWDTNPRSQVAWSDVPEANKIAMRAGVTALIEYLARG